MMSLIGPLLERKSQKFPNIQTLVYIDIQQSLHDKNNNKCQTNEANTSSDLKVATKTGGTETRIVTPFSILKSTLEIQRWF